MTRKLLFAAALALACVGGNAQELAVRIDDMGSFHSANAACIDCYRNGIARSVEVMTVCPWYPEAVKMLRANPGLDAGVHLVLNSEWENVKWRPLTHCPSLCDSLGYFYPMMWPSEAYPGQSTLENPWSFGQIEAEFRAQIERALADIPQLSHISGHMYSTGFAPGIYELVDRLSREYGLISIDNDNATRDLACWGVFYDGPHGTSAEKEESFIKMLRSLKEGERYIFLDHPAYADSEMSQVWHVGYRGVDVDRQGVTDLLKSPKVKAAADSCGVRLVTVRHIVETSPIAKSRQ